MTMETNLINIVLVDTIHPGNIGSVARAMKTMGPVSYTHLTLPTISWV